MKLRWQFTLGELLVVIMIVGILIAFLPPVRTPSGGPLHGAASCGNVLEARRLLESGLADVNEHGNMGRTPLHYAANNHHKEVVELLIEKGADVNARERYLCTPLHYALPSIEIVRLLVANGADVNAKDKEGQTPLDYAESNVRQLAAIDADLKAQHKDGHTPLDQAERMDYGEVINFLISKGAIRSPAHRDRR